MIRRRGDSRLGPLCAALCVIIVVAAAISFVRVLNLEVHLQQSYELGIGAGKLYLAQLGPMSLRGLRPAGWALRVGEDHWDYRPWMARFLVDVPLSVPFCVLAATRLALLWRAQYRRGRECPACAAELAGPPGGTCPHCGALLRRDRLPSREAVVHTVATFPLTLASGLIFAHGLLAIVLWGANWFQSNLALAFFIATGGLFAYGRSRLFYSWLRWRYVEPRRCPRCGYNLTGNASGRCPECGVPVKSEGTTA